MISRIPLFRNTDEHAHWQVLDHDRHTTKEVLGAILHSILFHRLFGTVKPQIFEVLDVTMVSLLPYIMLPLSLARSARCG
jgi:hypothetical protein